MLAWATFELTFDRYGGAVEVDAESLEVPVQGSSQRTFDHVHMRGDKRREGGGRDEGIQEEAHGGIDVC